MIFKNIMVPYDGSSFSKHAFKIAFDIAKKYDSQINLVVCVDTFGTGWYTKYYSGTKVIKQIEAKLEKELSNFKVIANKEGISVKFKIIETPFIVKTLVNFAKSNHVDLVVIGSHGRGFFDKLVLGSVTSGLTQKINCPILVVK